MKRRILIPGGAVVVAALVAVLLLATGGSAKNPSPHVAAGAALGVKQTALGKTLVDANGRTLYLFGPDHPNRSVLSRAGLAAWPAFTSTGMPKPTGGAVSTLIGTITGPAGGRQVTYNGHPLYYFVGDRGPGSVNGQRLNEFGGVWYVLSPNGHAVTRAASGPAPAPPAYGY
jgi:predicted lipoprotein with Yx(FWY)xxD motif